MAQERRHRKSVIWTTVIAVIVSVPVIYFVMQQTRNSYLLDLNHQAHEELKVHITHLLGEMENRYMITRIVGSDDRVISFLQNPNVPRQRALVNRFLSRIRASTGSIALIVDSRGKILASGDWIAPDTSIERFTGNRSNFKNTVEGKSVQYVATGTNPNNLRYYISIPVRLEGKIIGTAMTQTDPQALIMAHRQSDLPFIITNSSGVAIISSPDHYLSHAISPPEPDMAAHIRGTGATTKGEIKPVKTLPVETTDQIQLITLTRDTGSNRYQRPQQFLLARASVAASGWHAHVIWPISGLNATLTHRLLITVLSLILAWLLSLYGMERWRHLKQIEEHAVRDPLTRLYTRLYMLESATAMLAGHDRNTIPGVSAIMFDLDYFKTINDQYGHSAGDKVLVEVAKILIKECRDSDIPIRYGGDEFLVFVPTGDQQQVLQLAQRIRFQIKERHIHLAGTQIKLSLSGGIVSRKHFESLEKLIDRADQMMYQAKQYGRDQIKWEPHPTRSTDGT